jgi:hypothetical protein
MNAEWSVEVLALTNAHRESLGLTALVPAGTLTTAAEWKAAHMARYRYMSHEDPAPPVGRDWIDRVRDCGYEHSAGENIAYGYKTPEIVFEAWLNSPGHRDNIEDPSYRVIGVGAAVNSDGRAYWAQVFGTRVVAGDTTQLPAPTVQPDPTPSVEPSVDPSEPPVLVDSRNDAPIAFDDVTTTRPRRVVFVRVLDNDLDANEDPLSVEGLSDPRYGSVFLDQTGGLLTYRPRRGTGGKLETLTYSISDGKGGTDEGSVRIRIRRRT